MTVTAKTPGCIPGGTIISTTDNIIDNGASLAQKLALGTLAIGITSSPATGAGGGIGVGNALLSATTGGLYVSVNGAAPILLSGGGGGGGAGNPAGPTNSVQYNGGAAFAGTSNFTWNNSTGALAVCTTLGGACNNQSGVDAQSFSSTATGSDPAFETQNGTFHITGDGKGYFQEMNVTNAFNSLATGTASAIQQANGTFRITGAGDGLFQTVSMGLQAAPLTGIPGGTGTGDAALSATTAGLYLSLNGNPPVLISTTGGGGAGVPGTPTNSVQYNNAGAFAGSAALTWNNATGALAVCTTLGGACNNQSGVDAQSFSSTATGTDPAFETQSSTFHITGAGNGYFQGLNVTNTFNSLATGTSSAIQQANGTFTITGAGAANFQTTALALLANPATGLAGGTGQGNALLSATVAGLYLSLNGAAPVPLTGGGGGSGTAGGPSTSVQYNNAGTFAGSGNFVWNNAAAVATITGAVNSGFAAPVFTSSNTGTTAAFTNASGNFFVRGNGDAQFGVVTSLSTFNSAATGSTSAIQQSSGTFKITGDGAAGFQTVSMGLQSSPLTSVSGGTGTGSAALSATTAGLYLSVNGGAPALLAAGGAPGGPANAIQYNSGGTFGGTSNLTWNGTTALVSGAANAGFTAPLFNSTNTGGSNAVQSANGTFSIRGDGSASFQSIALTQGITVGSGIYGLTGGGALTVSSCSGCGAGVTSWNSRTGAVSLTKQDVTNVEGQGLGTGDTVLHYSVQASTGFSAAATGANAAYTQQSGQFQINGNGHAYFQSVCAYNSSPNGDTCNGSTPQQGTVQGAGLTAASGGASIRNNFANYGIAESDTGGNCNIGTVYAGGIGCSSDARLKDHIQPIGNALAGILALRPVTFQWKNNHEPAIGFIAQDVEKQFPALVKREADGYLSLSYMGLIPELVKAVQQLAARVAALEGGRR